ncbi:MAG: hypothetical protein J5643_05730 [Lachnospiraceae bacterium]|nr:hypothetical protein [Lachnospiraceae bacterium]
MSEREVSYDRLKEALAGVVSPDEHEATVRRSVRTVRGLFNWHVFTAVGFMAALILFISGVLDDKLLFHALSLFLIILASAGQIGIYCKVKELSGYALFFDKAAEYMFWGRALCPVLPNLCYGFREMVRDLDNRLFARWNRIPGPAYGLSIAAIILYFFALLARDIVWSWGFGSVAFLLIVIREFRYLYSVRLTIKALQQ